VPGAPHSPDWNHLCETAAAQEGLFTTRQAAEAGYSSPLLIHHTRAGRFQRVLRGIYRLVHFPVGEHEELVAVWLWSEQTGVFSHETAIALHGLSDAMPARVHMTLPAAWKKRRLRVPEGVSIHHAEVDPAEIDWAGPVPVTAVSRTLNDLAQSGWAPDMLQQAARQALRRGLTTRPEILDVERALVAFGGLTE
jgi:predicted transcriptional regulator of viral defense system